MTAEQIAREDHKNQTRRNGVTPYAYHLEQVVMRLKEAGEDQDVQDAGWLHDTIEEGFETVRSLSEKGVNPVVVEALSFLTHKKNETYSSYIRKVMTNRIAFKVKVADILSNLSDNPTKYQVIKYSNALLMLMGSKPDDKKEMPF